MGITFVPNAGDVLMCDFRGLIAPEMTKKRRVVILSPRARTYRPESYIVVPISKTAPSPPEPCHCEFKPRAYAFFDSVQSVWAKADMIMAVSATRLDRVYHNGRYQHACIRRDDLQKIRKSVLHAMGMESWQQVEMEVVVKATTVSLK